MLTYDHSVKVNGKWFKAGEQVVKQTPNPALVTTVEPETKAETEVATTEPAKRSNSKKK